MASISTPKFEAIKKEKFKNGGDWDGRHNCGENYELIRRSESGDRGGDGLGRVDRGRHGPRLAESVTGSARSSFLILTSPFLLLLLFSALHTGLGKAHARGVRFLDIAKCDVKNRSPWPAHSPLRVY